jgi:hypothetical protein
MKREPDPGLGRISAIRVVSPRGVAGLVVEEVDIPWAGTGRGVGTG